ncbi:Immunoglobulin-like fold [Plasmopara halstedii]|uniref:Immunoglobulin-like fold n=1 Tax=Plasmopara halstedii TaxID=4781 RepID=A0A0N7L6W9_PLAHL|nr:Immunoglobulin-like fold [Plasmopara halstedii]CEG45443.1 Immunoglobulin-like fold [Plasmopara halstedii]|eukprot:XP_024581812.1 Immunoglobulin-like fold [Plasmopara halstedii]
MTQELKKLRERRDSDTRWLYDQESMHVDRHGVQMGSQNGATHCPSAVNHILVSERTNCGVVIIDANTTPVPYEYIIKGLTPGNTHYTRVAAYNAIGYGPRRGTDPRSLSVPFEPPSAPRSPFNMLAPPLPNSEEEHQVVQQAVTGSLFGAPVMQLVRSTGTITGGYFTLSFGDDSDLY